MAKVNFKEFVHFTDISKTKTRTEDVRKMFADILYQRISGVMAGSLAIMIYRSEDAIELTSEELNLVRTVANQFCTPMFVDGLEVQLKGKEA